MIDRWGRGLLERPPGTLHSYDIHRRRRRRGGWETEQEVRCGQDLAAASTNVLVYMSLKLHSHNKRWPHLQCHRYYGIWCVQQFAHDHLKKHTTRYIRWFPFFGAQTTSSEPTNQPTSSAWSKSSFSSLRSRRVSAFVLSSFDNCYCCRDSRVETGDQ